MKWISVKDRLPETGGDYVVCAASDDWDTGELELKTSFARYCPAAGWHFAGSAVVGPVTHWMPLPDKPV